MMNRREALVRLGGIMAVGCLGTKPAVAAQLTRGIPAVSEEPLTIAHITDVHITEKMHGDKWVAECFRQLHAHRARPQLILNTGDTVYDSAKTDRAQAERYWKLWNDTVKREVSLPMHSCLGNHDIWGVRLKPSDPAMEDPMLGKKLGKWGVGLDKLYYSFDSGGWHFIMLDSVAGIFGEKENTWMGKLDDEQFEWLKRDLEATPADRPVLVGSHIPVLQVCTMNAQRPGDDEEYELGPRNMMSDARRIIDLFKKHENVKLCFSGHMHQLDRIELQGVTYICDGAMCGAKWKGSHYGVPPGYSITTLNPDGTFDYKYETYGWKQLG